MLNESHLVLSRILLLKIAYLFVSVVLRSNTINYLFGGWFWGRKPDRPPKTGHLLSLLPLPKSLCVRIWSIVSVVINFSMVLLLYQMCKGIFFLFLEITVSKWNKLRKRWAGHPMLKYITIYNSHPFILSLHMNKVARGTLHLFWFKLDSYLGMIGVMFAIGYRITDLLHVWNKYKRTNSVFLNHIKRDSMFKYQ